MREWRAVFSGPAEQETLVRACKRFPRLLPRRAGLPLLNLILTAQPRAQNSGELLAHILGEGQPVAVLLVPHRTVDHVAALRVDQLERDFDPIGRTREGSAHDV